jgi:ankyrin repeat protein
LIISTFLSFLTYHIFVRKSFIGKILNGKKYINNSLDLTNFFNKKNLYVISIFVISLSIIAFYEKNSNSKILNLALHKDFTELKKIITENEGITLYSKRGDGRTPLHLISTKVNDFSIINTNAIQDSIELILQDGLNVDVRDNFGNSPLHYAVRSGNYPAIFSLLMNGANPNIQNIVNDSTPLHNAAAKGDKKILDILLMNQADPNLINKFGKKPIDYYKQFNDKLDNVLIKQLE